MAATKRQLCPGPSPRAHGRSPGRGPAQGATPRSVAGSKVVLPINSVTFKQQHFSFVVKQTEHFPLVTFHSWYGTIITPSHSRTCSSSPKKPRTHEQPPPAPTPTPAPAPGSRPCAVRLCVCLLWASLSRSHTACGLLCLASHTVSCSQGPSMWRRESVLHPFSRPSHRPPDGQTMVVCPSFADGHLGCLHPWGSRTVLL